MTRFRRAVGALGVALLPSSTMFASEIAPGGITLSGRELLDQGMGAVFVACGIAALGLFTMRAGRRSPTLLFLAFASILYGLRLADDSVFMLGLPLRAAAYIKPLITYLLPLPLFGYVFVSIGRRWRSLSFIAMLVQVVYCVGATVLDLIHGPGYSMGPNNYLVLSSILILTIEGLADAKRMHIT